MRKEGEKRQAGGIAGSCRQVVVPAFGVLPPHLRTNPNGMLPASEKLIGPIKSYTDYDYDIMMLSKNVADYLYTRNTVISQPLPIRSS